MTRIILFISIIIFFLSFQNTKAQSKDSTKVRKNIIRWNPTPMVMVGPKSIVLGYERLVRPSQTISINIGYLEKSPMTDKEGVPLQIFDQNNKGGFDISLDYRFYFRKRNKYPAPDGLYWGPYASYYGIWQDASINLLNNGVIKNTVHYNGKLQMFSLGLQLGYQFIIKERFSIDLILLGPSYTYYDLNMSLRFDTDIDINDPFYKDLMDYLSDNSPFLSEFINKGSIEANGRLKLNFYGFRYAIQFGYVF